MKNKKLYKLLKKVNKNCHNTIIQLSDSAILMDITEIKNNCSNEMIESFFRIAKNSKEDVDNYIKEHEDCNGICELRNYQTGSKIQFLYNEYIINLNTLYHECEYPEYDNFSKYDKERIIDIFRVYNTIFGYPILKY